MFLGSWAAARAGECAWKDIRRPSCRKHCPRKLAGKELKGARRVALYDFIISLHVAPHVSEPPSSNRVKSCLGTAASRNLGAKSRHPPRATYTNAETSASNKTFFTDNNMIFANKKIVFERSSDRVIEGSTDRDIERSNDRAIETSSDRSIERCAAAHCELRWQCAPLQLCHLSSCLAKRSWRGTELLGDD